MNRLRFLAALFRDKYIAAVAPTAFRSISNICKKICFDTDITVVEYGAGSGAFTRYLLKNMSKHSRLIALEQNNLMYAELQKIKDQRLIVFNESVEHVLPLLEKCGIKRVDYVLSGIPFSYYDSTTQQNIIYATKKILSDRGSFIIYQHTPKMKSLLQSNFSSCTVGVELFNIPPLVVFEARK